MLEVSTTQLGLSAIPPSLLLLLPRRQPALPARGSRGSPEVVCYRHAPRELGGGFLPSYLKHHI